MIGNTIRRLRLERGLTLRRLAELTGVTDSYISLLETGAEEPSLSALRRLSQALGCPMAAFFEEDFPEPALRRASRGGGQSLPDGEQSSPDRDFSWEILSPSFSDGGERTTLLRLRLQPGARLQSSGSPGQLCIWLQSGTVRFQLPEAEYIMRSGDSLYLQALTPFTAVCLGEEPGWGLAALAGTELPKVEAGTSGERSSL